MTAELIGILTVGVALAALQVTTLRGLRTDMRSDVRAIRGESDRVRDELRGDTHALDDRMRTQERSTAKLDGLLEGLREAAVVRAGPRSGAAEATRGDEQAPGWPAFADRCYGCVDHDNAKSPTVNEADRLPVQGRFSGLPAPTPSSARSSCRAA